MPHATTVRAPRLPGTPIRGYRIAFRLVGQLGPTTFTGTLWSADIPAQWEEVQAEVNVASAILFRSGRKYRFYSAERKAS